MLSAVPYTVQPVCFSESLGGFLERWVVLKQWVSSCYQEMIMDPSLCELVRVTAWASWSQVCVCVCCFLTDISEFVTVYILKTAIGDWSSESSILVKTQNKAKHFKIYQTSGQVYVDPSPTFASVLEVVEYYQTHPLSTSDKLKRPCIRVRLSFSVHFSSLSSYACFSSYACLPYSHTLFQFCHMRKWLKEVLHFYKNISFCLFS